MSAEQSEIQQSTTVTVQSAAAARDRLTDIKRRGESGWQTVKVAFADLAEFIRNGSYRHIGTDSGTKTYETADAFLRGEFPGLGELAIPADARRELVEVLAGEELTQQVIANRLGVSQQTVSNDETALGITNTGNSDGTSPGRGRPRTDAEMQSAMTRARLALGELTEQEQQVFRAAYGTGGHGRGADAAARGHRAALAVQESRERAQGDPPATGSSDMATDTQVPPVVQDAQPGRDPDGSQPDWQAAKPTAPAPDGAPKSVRLCPHCGGALDMQKLVAQFGQKTAELAQLRQKAEALAAERNALKAQVLELEQKSDGSVSVGSHATPFTREPAPGNGDAAGGSGRNELDSLLDPDGVVG